MVGDNGLEPMTSCVSESILENYLTHLAMRGLSTTYINSNRTFLNGYTLVAKVLSTESAMAYLAQYTNRKPNTLARYAGYLKGLLEFAGHRFDLKIKRPKLLPEVVPDEAISKLKEAIRNHKTHKSSIARDLALIDTAINTGLRRSELANLLVKHVNFDQRRLTVVGGKGSKDRVIPLMPDLTLTLKTVCIDKLQDERVFGLNYRSLGNKLREWATKAGVDLHTHSLRHYFATRLVERGANIRAVQELLGHTSLNTTQVYLAVTGKHLEDAISLLDFDD